MSVCQWCIWKCVKRYANFFNYIIIAHIRVLRTRRDYEGACTIHTRGQIPLLHIPDTIAYVIKRHRTRSAREVDTEEVLAQQRAVGRILTRLDCLRKAHKN